MIWWELLNFTMLVVMEWTSDTHSGTQMQYLLTISNLRNFQTSRFASLSLLHLMGAPVILKLSWLLHAGQGVLSLSASWRISAYDWRGEHSSRNTVTLGKLYLTWKFYICFPSFIFRFLEPLSILPRILMVQKWRITNFVLRYTTET